MFENFKYHFISKRSKPEPAQPQVAPPPAYSQHYPLNTGHSVDTVAQYEDQAYQNGYGLGV